MAEGAVAEEERNGERETAEGVVAGGTAEGAPRARVLVVGCAGAVGSHLCERLVEGGRRVVGVDDMSDRGSTWHHLRVSSSDAFVHERCDAYEGAAAAIALHRPETVVHLFPADGDRFAHLRSHGLCLDRAVREGVSTYVYGSDCHVYSFFGEDDERAPPRRRRGGGAPRGGRDALGQPDAARAITCRMGEDMLRLYATRLGGEGGGGMRGLCARLPPTFGPRCTPEGSTAVALVRAVAAGREARVPGGREGGAAADPRAVILDLCPEADVARALAGLLAEAASPPSSLVEVRYLGPCRPVSLLALLAACERVTGRTALVAAPPPDAAPETIEDQLLRMPHVPRRVRRGLPSCLPASPPPALVAQLELALFATVDGLVGGGGVRSLCCFAAYGGTDRLPGDTVRYVCELARSFDRVVVITNEERGEVLRTGLPSNAVVWQVPHGGRDFGLHWRMLAPMAEVWGIGGRYAHLERVALVNDSCRIVRSLRPLFRWAEDGALAFWGVSSSSVPVVHLQSYFLVFEGASAMAALLAFVRAHDIERYSRSPVRDVIETFELGLSQHMAARGFPVARAAPYTTEGLLALPPPLPGSIRGDNPSHNMWDRMLAARCPLVKNRRHPVAGDEAFIRRHTALDFLPDD